MGAWGHGNFENDAASDWIARVEEPSEVRQALEVFRPDADANDCCRALAAAEVVAACLGRPAADAPEEVLDWAGDHAKMATAKVVKRAIEVTKQIGSSSELQQLFDDGERNDEWHAALDDLARRLAG